MVKIKSTKLAFTLIELSVVLLVLAFLIGGVLTARKVVQRAQIQSISVEIEQFKKSIAIFYDSYNNLPGDLTCESASNYPELVNYGCANYFVAKTLASFSINCTDDGSCPTISQTNNGLIEGGIETSYAIRHLILTNSITNTCVSNVAQCNFKAESSNGLTINPIIPISIIIDSADPTNRLASGDYQYLKAMKFSSDIAIFPVAAVSSAYVSSTYTTKSTSFVINNKNVSLYTEAYLSSIDGSSVGKDYNLGSSSPANYKGNFIAIMNTNLTLGAVPQDIARQIDLKFDDGLPFTGNLVAGMAPMNFNPDFNTSGRIGCIKTLPTGYSVASGSPISTYTSNAVVHSGLSDSNVNQYDSAQTLGKNLIYGCNMFFKVIVK